MTQISSPQRATPFDNFGSSRPNPKGGRSDAGVLSRSHPRFGKRLNALADTKSEEGKTRLLAHEASELDRKEVEAADADANHYAQAIAFHQVDPNGPEMAELQAKRDNAARKKAIKRENDAKRDADPANLGLAAQTFEKVQHLIASRVREEALVPVLVEVDPGDDVLAAVAAKSSERDNRKARRAKAAMARRLQDAEWRGLMRDLDTLAAQAEIGISGLHDGARKLSIAWPTRVLDAEPAAHGSGNRPRVVDTEALVARFFRKEVEADLRAALDAEYAELDPDEILDPGEKRRLLASLDREIDQLDCELAELIWLAREAGHDVQFPADLPAAAILGVAA